MNVLEGNSRFSWVNSSTGGTKLAHKPRPAWGAEEVPAARQRVGSGSGGKVVGVRSASARATADKVLRTVFAPRENESGGGKGSGGARPTQQQRRVATTSPPPHVGGGRKTSLRSTDVDGPDGGGGGAAGESGGSSFAVSGSFLHNLSTLGDAAGGSAPVNIAAQDGGGAGFVPYRSGEQDKPQGVPFNSFADVVNAVERLWDEVGFSAAVASLYRTAFLQLGNPISWHLANLHLDQLSREKELILMACEAIRQREDTVKAVQQLAVEYRGWATAHAKATNGYRHHPYHHGGTVEPQGGGGPPTALPANLIRRDVENALREYRTATVRAVNAVLARDRHIVDTSMTMWNELASYRESHGERHLARTFEEGKAATENAEYDDSDDVLVDPNDEKQQNRDQEGRRGSLPLTDAASIIAAAEEENAKRARLSRFPRRKLEPFLWRGEPYLLSIVQDLHRHAFRNEPLQFLVGCRMPWNPFALKGSQWNFAEIVRVGSSAAAGGGGGRRKGAKGGAIQSRVQQRAEAPGRPKVIVVERVGPFASVHTGKSVDQLTEQALSPEEAQRIFHSFNAVLVNFEKYLKPLQARWKGKAVRRQLLRQWTSVLTIQKYVRRFLAQCYRGRLRAMQVYKVVAPVCKGYLDRRVVFRLRRGIILLQAAVRGYQARERLRHQHAAALTIQQWYQQFLHVRRCARKGIANRLIRLQRVGRAMLCRCQTAQALQKYKRKKREKKLRMKIAKLYAREEPEQRAHVGESENAARLSTLNPFGEQLGMLGPEFRTRLDMEAIEGRERRWLLAKANEEKNALTPPPPPLAPEPSSSPVLVSPVEAAPVVLTLPAPLPPAPAPAPVMSTDTHQPQSITATATVPTTAIPSVPTHVLAQPQPAPALVPALPHGPLSSTDELRARDEEQNVVAAARRSSAGADADNSEPLVTAMPTLAVAVDSASLEGGTETPLAETVGEGSLRLVLTPMATPTASQSPLPAAPVSPPTAPIISSGTTTDDSDPRRESLDSVLLLGSRNSSFLTPPSRKGGHSPPPSPRHWDQMLRQLQLQQMELYDKLRDEEEESSDRFFEVEQFQFLLTEVISDEREYREALYTEEAKHWRRMQSQLSQGQERVRRRSLSTLRMTPPSPPLQAALPLENIMLFELEEQHRDRIINDENSARAMALMSHTKLPSPVNSSDPSSRSGSPLMTSPDNLGSLVDRAPPVLNLEKYDEKVAAKATAAAKKKRGESQAPTLVERTPPVSPIAVCFDESTAAFATSVIVGTTAAALEKEEEEARTELLKSFGVIQASVRREIRTSRGLAICSEDERKGRLQVQNVEKLARVRLKAKTGFQRPEITQNLTQVVERISSSANIAPGPSSANTAPPTPLQGEEGNEEEKEEGHVPSAPPGGRNSATAATPPPPPPPPRPKSPSESPPSDLGVPLLDFTFPREIGSPMSSPPASPRSEPINVSPSAAVELPPALLVGPIPLPQGDQRWSLSVSSNTGESSEENSLRTSDVEIVEREDRWRLLTTEREHWLAITNGARQLVLDEEEWEGRMHVTVQAAIVWSLMSVESEAYFTLSTNYEFYSNIVNSMLQEKKIEELVLQETLASVQRSAFQHRRRSSRAKLMENRGLSQDGSPLSPSSNSSANVSPQSSGSGDRTQKHFPIRRKLREDPLLLISSTAANTATTVVTKQEEEDVFGPSFASPTDGLEGSGRQSPFAVFSRQVQLAAKARCMWPAKFENLVTAPAAVPLSDKRRQVYSTLHELQVFEWMERVEILHEEDRHFFELWELSNCSRSILLRQHFLWEGYKCWHRIALRRDKFQRELTLEMKERLAARPSQKKAVRVIERFVQNRKICEYRRKTVLDYGSPTEELETPDIGRKKNRAKTVNFADDGITPLGGSPGLGTSDISSTSSEEEDHHRYGPPFTVSPPGTILKLPPAAKMIDETEQQQHQQERLLSTATTGTAADDIRRGSSSDRSSVGSQASSLIPGLGQPMSGVVMAAGSSGNIGSDVLSSGTTEEERQEEAHHAGAAGRKGLPAAGGVPKILSSPVGRAVGYPPSKTKKAAPPSPPVPALGFSLADLPPFAQRSLALQIVLLQRTGRGATIRTVLSIQQLEFVHRRSVIHQEEVTFLEMVAEPFHRRHQELLSTAHHGALNYLRLMQTTFDVAMSNVRRAGERRRKRFLRLIATVFVRRGMRKLQGCREALAEKQISLTNILSVGTARREPIINEEAAEWMRLMLFGGRLIARPQLVRRIQHIGRRYLAQLYGQRADVQAKREADRTVVVRDETDARTVMEREILQHFYGRLQELREQQRSDIRRLHLSAVMVRAVIRHRFVVVVSVFHLQEWWRQQCVPRLPGIRQRRKRDLETAVLKHVRTDASQEQVEAAALRIQCCARKFIARRRTQKLREAKALRIHEERRLHATRLLQAWYRTDKARRFKQRRSHIMVIQTAVRLWIGRRRVALVREREREEKKQADAAKLITAFFLRWKDRNASAAAFGLSGGSATQQPKKEKSGALDEQAAAEIIQRAIRRFLASARVERKKKVREGRRLEVRRQLAAKTIAGAMRRFLDLRRESEARAWQKAREEAASGQEELTVVISATEYFEPYWKFSELAAEEEVQNREEAAEGERHDEYAEGPATGTAAQEGGVPGDALGGSALRYSTWEEESSGAVRTTLTSEATPTSYSSFSPSAQGGGESPRATSVFPSPAHPLPQTKESEEKVEVPSGSTLILSPSAAAAAVVDAEDEVVIVGSSDDISHPTSASKDGRVPPPIENEAGAPAGGAVVSSPQEEGTTQQEPQRVVSDERPPTQQREDDSAASKKELPATGTGEEAAVLEGGAAGAPVGDSEETPYLEDPMLHFGDESDEGEEDEDWYAHQARLEGIAIVGPDRSAVSLSPQTSLCTTTGTAANTTGTVLADQSTGGGVAGASSTFDISPSTAAGYGEHSSLVSLGRDQSPGVARGLDDSSSFLDREPYVAPPPPSTTAGPTPSVLVQHAMVPHQQQPPPTMTGPQQPITLDELANSGSGSSSTEEGTSFMDHGEEQRKVPFAHIELASPLAYAVDVEERTYRGNVDKQEGDHWACLVDLFDEGKQRVQKRVDSQNRLLASQQLWVGPRIRSVASREKEQLGGGNVEADTSAAAQLVNDTAAAALAARYTAQPVPSNLLSQLHIWESEAKALLGRTEHLGASRSSTGGAPSTSTSSSPSFVDPTAMSTSLLPMSGNESSDSRGGSRLLLPIEGGAGQGQVLDTSEWPEGARRLAQQTASAVAPTTTNPAAFMRQQPQETPSSRRLSPPRAPPSTYQQYDGAVLQQQQMLRMGDGLLTHSMETPTRQGQGGGGLPEISVQPPSADRSLMRAGGTLSPPIALASSSPTPFDTFPSSSSPSLRQNSSSPMSTTGGSSRMIMVSPSRGIGGSESDRTARKPLRRRGAEENVDLRYLSAHYRPSW